MTEYEALRREIEVRIWRQTIYKAVDALNSKVLLKDEIDDNDNTIKLIGEYLRGGGDRWEDFYKSKMEERIRIR